MAGCHAQQPPRPFERWPMAVTVHHGRSVLAHAGGPLTVVVEPSTVMQVGDLITCMAASPEDGFLVFCTDTLIRVRHRGGVWGSREFSEIEHTVRRARPLGDGLLALLTGGDRRTSAVAGDAESPPWLSGGEVRLAWLDGARLVIGEPEDHEQLAEANPYRIRAGRFAGETNVLVFVYTQAPFDDVVRRRPWICRVLRGDDGRPRLAPRWRGTSFSHPFRDATFCDLTGTGEGEIAALEVARDGGRLLTAYHFEGFGLEGMAPSLALPRVEDRLEAADWVGDDASELVVRCTDGRFVFFGLDAEAEELTESLTVEGPRDVLGWLVTSRHGGEAGDLLCVLPDGGAWEADSWNFDPRRPAE